MNDSKCCKKFQHKKDQFNAPKWFKEKKIQFLAFKKSLEIFFIIKFNSELK